ncbi:hypothetical protein [Mesorhizobium sp.]|nr:hypothetical protein [Mesorhizobium sp.]
MEIDEERHCTSEHPRAIRSAGAVWTHYRMGFRHRSRALPLGDPEKA